jgi:hypothetical protein
LLQEPAGIEEGIMAVSRPATLAISGVAAGASLLTALVMTPLMIGTAAAAVGGCSATAAIQSQWGSGTTAGEIVTVTVANTSAQAATRWTVTWTATGQVVSAWNATVSASGGTATATNVAYNGSLAPDASTTFGMQLAGTAAAPTMSCANDAVPPTSGSPSVTPSSSGDATVTDADAGRTVTLLVGQTLAVSLPANYRPATASGSALSQLSSSGGFPTGLPFAALYRAVAPGSVDLSSQTDYACLHATPPCAVPIALWVVHVRVVDGSNSGGQTVTVTTADNGRALSLRVGDTLVVSLPSQYDPPPSNTGGVLVQRDVTGGYPTNQPLVAHYTAAVPGQADLTTNTDYPCNHDPTPCPGPIMRWTIHVTVTA